VEVAAHEVPTSLELENSPARWGRVLRFATSALVCGHVTLDRIDGALVPGGSVFYAAHALAALGAHARAFTAAGPDLPADALAPGGPGIAEVLVVPAARTTRFENSYLPSGRRAQRVLSPAPPLDPERLPAAWRKADVLFLAPVIGEIDLVAFQRAVAAPVVGLGVQGLVREASEGGAVSARRFEPDPAALAGVTAAFLGEDEAAAQPDLAARLAAAVPIVVVTRGAGGCEVTEGGRTRRVGIHPAREVDPTGAGDVFAAAFLLSLARGADAVEAARLGAGAASIAVEAPGGAALPRLREAAERAARVPVAVG
jgi:sugar/nucleoside kinase (ribokinase family)